MTISNKELRRDVDVLKIDNTQLRTDNDAKKDEIIQLNNDIAQLRKENQQLKVSKCFSGQGSHMYLYNCF